LEILRGGWISKAKNLKTKFGDANPKNFQTGYGYFLEEHITKHLQNGHIKKSIDEKMIDHMYIAHTATV